MSGEAVWYIDSSALIKLVVPEPESPVLARFAHSKRLVTSSLAITEVGRALHGLPRKVRSGAAQLLDRVDMLEVSDDVLTSAVSLKPPELRSLDAIHLASASAIGNSLAGVITYDRRMQAAASSYGWRVEAPV